MVTGATGALGMGVINALVSKSNAKNIYALARSEEKAAALKKSGANVRIGDYDDYDSLLKAFKGIETLYMVSNTDVTRRMTQQNNVFDAAVEAGVGRIVYTSYQRKSESSDSPIRPVTQGHLHIEARLKESGLTYTILKHGTYAEMIPIFAGEDVLTKQVIYYPAGEGKISFVVRKDLAEAAAIILLDETGKYDFKSLEFTGPEALSWGEIAEMMSAITNVPIKYVSPTVDEYIKAGTEAGVPAEYVNLFANFGKVIKAGENDKVSGTLEGVLGRERTSVQTYLKNTYGTSDGQSAGDEQSVKNVVQAYLDGYNDGAFKNVEAYTTEDWVHINPIGGVTKGREEVMNELRPLCQTILKGVTLTEESCKVSFMSPTVAVANVVEKCSDYEFPAGVKHINERHMKTYVIVKKDNGWRLTLDQNTVIVAL